MANNIPIGSPVRTRAIINRYFVKAKKNLGAGIKISVIYINNAHAHTQARARVR